MLALVCDLGFLQDQMTMILFLAYLTIYANGPWLDIFSFLFLSSAGKEQGCSGLVDVMNFNALMRWHLVNFHVVVRWLVVLESQEMDFLLFSPRRFRGCTFWSSRIATITITILFDRHAGLT